MTDTASSRLPEDMIQLIANNYFTVPDFLILRAVSQAFNQALSSKDFLLSLYKNLCFLNKSLPSTFSPEHALFDVQMAFKKVKERQNEEIAFFNFFYAHPDGMHRLQIDQLLKTPYQTIPQMIFRDKLLNNLNTLINDLAIFQNEETEELTLTGITRFVFSEENANYLKKIKFLTFSDSSMDTLNLEDFTEVEELRCREIKLIVVNVKGCKNVTELICDKNKIVYLNTEGCAALEKLRCEENQITDLDLSGRLALKGVHAEGNQLVNFNAQGCQKLSWLHLTRNPKLGCLNLQGCSILQRVVKDNNTNYLMALDVNGTPLERRQEWIGLKQRVELRYSAQQLRLSSKKEVEIDDLSNKFERMSMYIPSFRKENPSGLVSVDNKSKENNHVTKKAQLR